MPDTAALQKLKDMISRTVSGIPKIQDKAIETGDFTELRRAQGVVKQLSGLADRFTGQQEGAPVANVPAKPPAPEPPMPPTGPPTRTVQDRVLLWPEKIRDAVESIPRGIADLVSPKPPYAPQPEPPKPETVIVKPGEYRQPDGSIKDFVNVEIPKAIYDISRLAGQIAGEKGQPESRYVPEWARNRPPGEPAPLEAETSSLPIRAEMPPAVQEPPVGIGSLLPKRPETDTQPWGRDVQFPGDMGVSEEEIIKAKAARETPPGVGSLVDLPPARRGTQPWGDETSFPASMGVSQEEIDKAKAERQAGTFAAQHPELPPDFMVGVQPVIDKAKQLGDSPASMLDGVIQEAQATPGDDLEKDFLARVKMLGLDRKVPTWERFITALAYGAANIFSRWVSRNWRMPLNFPDLYSQDRRDDETRRQIAIQLLSERAAEKRQTASQKAMAERQKATHESQQKVAEIRATAKGNRQKAKDAIVELNQNLDAIGKINRELEREYEQKIGAVTTRIKAADDILKNRGTPGAFPGEYKFDPADVEKHEAVVAPLYAELERLRVELGKAIKDTRSGIMK